MNMSLKQKIAADIRTSLKAGRKEVVSVLRMLNSKILEREVELRSKKGRDYQLSDEEVVEVIASYAKQRNQSIESYRAGGREDLVLKEEQELEILQPYLPKQLSMEELTQLVETSIKEVGAQSMKDLGAVMRQVMPKVKGAADGKQVNAIVRDKLASM